MSNGIFPDKPHPPSRYWIQAASVEQVLGGLREQFHEGDLVISKIVIDPIGQAE
jgi:hypothetical protein